jgi:secreted trypsin-like serine protease
LAHFFRGFILISILAISSGCSKNSATRSPLDISQSARIFDGTTAELQSPIAKSTVMINLPNGNVCTGILLNDHVVLTAAHCLSHGPSGYYVYLPEAFDRAECKASLSQEISLPPNSKANDDGDVLPDLGLIRLSQPLCTPAKVILDSKVSVGDKLRAAGFGTGSARTRPDYFDMTVIPSDKKTLKDIYTTNGPKGPTEMDEWKEIEPYQKEYAENFIFALADLESATLCSGDSGGPIYREVQGVVHLVGVVRGAFMHSEKGVAACYGAYVQLFSPVGPHLDWIQDKLKTW